MLLTFVLTVLVDLTVAIGIGVTLASLQFVHRMGNFTMLQSHGRHLQNDLDGNEELGIIQQDELPIGVAAFSVSGPLFFGVASTMVDTLQQIGEVPKILILRMRLVPYIDVSGLNALAALIKFCEGKGTQVILSGLSGQPEDILSRGGIKDNQRTVFVAENYNAAVDLSSKLAAAV
jgi:SulP family sulfate permease